MIEFNDERHEYRLRGQVIPHVTKITDSLSDYYGVPDEIMQRKRDLGSAVHLATQYHDEGDLNFSALPAIVKPYVSAYILCREQTGFAPACIEQRVWSEVYGIAGTLDRAGHFEQLGGIKPREFCIVDLKATYTIMPAVGPQTAAYERLYNEHAERKATRRFAVQLKPDGTYQLHECKDRTDWSVFASALTIFNWRARHAA